MGGSASSTDSVYPHSGVSQRVAASGHVDVPPPPPPHPEARPRRQNKGIQLGTCVVRGHLSVHLACGWDPQSKCDVCMCKAIMD